MDRKIFVLLRSVGFSALPAALLFLASCASSSRAYRLDAHCERTAIGNYEIRWGLDPVAKGKIRISVSDDPSVSVVDSAFDEWIDAGRVTYVTKDNFSPKFFRLSFPDQDVERVVGLRVTRLDSVRYMWDMGGVTNSDGFDTSWGRVCYSELFRNFSPLDVRKINSMRFHSQIVLGCEAGRGEDVETDGSTVYLPSASSLTLESFLQQTVDSSLSRKDIRSKVRSLFLSYIDQNNDQTRQALLLAADPEMHPILFCSEYPWGVLSFLGMLMLKVCDVPDRAVIDVYTEINRLADMTKWHRKVCLASEGQQEAFTYLITAHGDLLMEVMDEIRVRYGSFSNYFSQEIGFGPEDQARLRRNLLSN
ncbi:MAG: tyrosine-protein phosphatase [Porphyromonas sp.]|nr:tyrosine-protein phosphatase [Porphyromonas sp.]